MSHFNQIKNLYKNVRNLAAAAKNDAELSKLTQSMLSDANRLLYNAARHGLTASFSAGYRNKIDAKLDEVKRVAGNPYVDERVSERVMTAAGPVTIALNAYIPESMPAQMPKTQAPARESGSRPGEPGYDPSPKKFDEPKFPKTEPYPVAGEDVFPGPNRPKDMTTPAPADVGVARERQTIDLTQPPKPGIVPESQVRGLLPKTPEEERKSLWQADSDDKQYAKANERFQMLAKIAKRLKR